MSPVAITYAVLAVAVVLFVTNRLPVAVVALCVALVLYLTGVVDLGQALGGFGDPTVVFIATLFVVGEGLDAAGVTAWLGRRLIAGAGGRTPRVLVLTMLMVAGLSALISPTGAVAALVPVAVVMCVRLRLSPSRLLMPLAFAAHAGSMLLLTGTPVNVLVADAARDSGAGRIGFASFALVGVPLLVATVVVVLLFGTLLLPRRTPPSMPEDLSALSRKLVHDYGLADGKTDTPPVTAPHGFPVLFTADRGAAEVVVPPRSNVLGRQVFAGMTTPDGDVVVLAVHRNGEPIPAGGTELLAGDTLLVRGSWEALESYLASRQVLPVVEPDLVRRQAAPLDSRAWRAVGVTAVMVALLATGLVPAAVAGLVAAIGMVVLGVLRVEQAYQAVDWTTVVLIGAMIPLSTAMVTTGAADRLATALVAGIGDGGPRMLLAGLFVLTALLGQLISNTATALIVVPIALATAAETGVSALPLLMGVAVAAAAALLTPVATPANMMVLGPGGYRFGDYWRLGLPLLVVYAVVAVFLVPVFWPF